MLAVIEKDRKIDDKIKKIATISEET